MEIKPPGFDPHVWDMFGGVHVGLPKHLDLENTIWRLESAAIRPLGFLAFFFLFIAKKLVPDIRAI